VRAARSDARRSAFRSSLAQKPLATLRARPDNFAGKPSIKQQEMDF
jgi:hypothetical protein